MLAIMMDSRLQMKRVALGMTREYVAEALHTSKDMIFKLEKRKRQITEAWLKKFATLYQCPPSELLEDTNNSKSPILGSAGAGNKVYPIDDLPMISLGGMSEHIQPDWPVDFVDTPYGLSNVAAIRVDGDSMYPMMKNNWLVFYQRRAVTDFDNYVGDLVLAWLADGSLMIKTLRRGTRYGKYNLESHNAPLIEDVELKYIAKIVAIVPR